MLATITTTLAESEHVVNQLPFPNWVFFVITFVVFTAAALVTWSYRNVAHRHNDKWLPDSAYGEPERHH